MDLEQVQPMPEATLREKESYDPWESVVVQWDRGELLAQRLLLRSHPTFLPGPHLTDPHTLDARCTRALHRTAAEPGRYENVNPWEMEIDPEEERKRLEEARRQQQAAARAARARGSSRRWVGGRGGGLRSCSQRSVLHSFMRGV